MFQSKNIFTVLLLLATITTTQAQNKDCDWGIGVYGSLYSYSAMLENKYTSPYQYNLGTQVSVSRYLNNNFDVELMGGRTTTKYLTGILGEENPYTATKMYDGAFSLKYKLDNGYIIKHEDYVVSPFFKVGVGANYVDCLEKMDVVVPAGLGLSIAMGKYVSLVYETGFRYTIGSGSTYATHALGLKGSLIKASKSRLTATKEREQERKLVRIEKQRDEREKERLARLMEREEKEKVVSALMSDFVSSVENAGAKEEPDAVAKEETFSAAPLKDKVVAPVIEEKPAPAKPVIKEKVIEVAPTAPVKTAVVEEKPAPAKPVIKEKVIEVAPTAPVKIAVVEEKPAPAKPVIEEAPVKVEDDYCLSSAEVLTEFGKSITFDVNSDRIVSRMHTALASVVETMQRCEETKFAVIAHTDSDGDAAFNTRLANRRAQAVKDYLIAQGIDASRLTTLAYGEYMSKEESSEKDKAANRRISFKINRTSF